VQLALLRTQCRELWEALLGAIAALAKKAKHWRKVARARAYFY
jgi:hypothetical protein